MNKIQISLLKQGSNVEIAQAPEVEQEELARLICGHTWSPAVYRMGYRNKENARRSDLFVMDVDGGCSLEEAKRLFADHWHIIGTTRSHQKEKNGATCDRFRVVLLLDKPMENDLDCKKTFKYLQEQYGFLDEACKDISRLFYPCVDIVSINNDILGTVRDCSGDPDPLSSTAGQIDAAAQALDFKGSLYQQTMDFFFRGSAPGTRNTRLYQAASDAKEQGYSYEEVCELVKRCGEINSIPNFFPDIHPKHLNTLNRVFSLPSTNPVRLDSAFEQKDDPNSKDRMIEDMMEYLDDDESNKGIATGIAGLDDLLGGGFRGGEVTVIHGNAKIGKTTLLHKIQHNLFERGIRQGYAPRESKASRHALPHYVTLRWGRNPKVDPFWKDIRHEVAAYIKQIPMEFMPGMGKASWQELSDWMGKYAYQGVKIFWFDHLHYLTGLGASYQEVLDMFTNFKLYAVENNIHVIMIVQAITLGKDDSIGTGSIRGGAGIFQTLDNLWLYTDTQPPNSAVNIPNCRRIKVIGRDDLVKPGEIYMQYDQVRRDLTELRVDPNAQSRPDDRVQAYGQFEKNLRNGINNKWRVN